MKTGIVLGWFLLTAIASAQLTWETRRVESEVLPGQESAAAVFKYKNETESAIGLRATIPDCRCTRLVYEQEPIQPGATGELTLHFVVESRAGKQMIRAEVLETGEKATRGALIWELDILPVVSVEPEEETVVWEVGDPLKPKEITITARDGVKFQMKGVESASPLFRSELQPAKAGGSWSVQITPVSTDKPHRGVIFLKSDYPEKHPRTYYLRAKVVQP